MPAALQQHPGHHAPDHEQAGDGEVEEVEDADRQRERHPDQDIDCAQHDAVDDLLRNHAETPFAVAQTGSK